MAFNSSRNFTISESLIWIALFGNLANVRCRNCLVEVHLKFVFGFLQIKCLIIAVQIQKPLAFFIIEFRWHSSSGWPLYWTYVNRLLSPQIYSWKYCKTCVLVTCDPVCYGRNALVVHFRYLSFAISQKVKPIQCVILYFIASMFFIHICQNFRHFIFTFLLRKNSFCFTPILHRSLII